MTLKFKIFFYFVLPIIASMALLTMHNSKQEMAQLKELTKDSFVANTNNASLAISKNSTTTITLLEVSADVLAESLFGKRAESVAYLNSILKSFRDFSAISLAYEINADGNDEKNYNSLMELQADANKLSTDFYDAYDYQNNNIVDYIDSWVTETENGRFLMRLKRAGEFVDIEPLKGIESREHYASIKNRYTNLGDKSIYTSDPSFENVNLHIEYISPIILNDKFVGEVAFYKSLYYLFNSLESFKKSPNGNFFLLNNTGKIVANTLDVNISTASIDDLYLNAENKFNTSFLRYKNGRLIRDEDLAQQTNFSSYSTLYRDILRLIARGDKVQDNFIEYTDANSKKRYIISFTLLKELDWQLIQIVPEDELYNFGEKSQMNAINEIVLAFIVFIFACLIFSYYTKRLNRTTQAVQNIYEGKLHLQIPEIKQSKDESVKLINAVSLLSSKISSTVMHSKTANNQLIDTAEKLTTVSTDYEHSTKHFDSHIGEISRSLNQINDTSANIKDSVEELSKSLKRASILAKEEKTLIENSFKSIEDISENALKLLNRVKLIKDRAKSALNCLNQISKIISQANLLSINTSIEAKKSKEKSDSFSKISKEIAILAKLVNEYSKEVALIIRDLLESSFVAIEQILKFSEQIDKIKKDFAKLNPSIENTTLSIDNILPEVHKINDSLYSQNLRKAQLKETISLLDNNAKQASLLYRQFIDLRRELNFAIEQITHEISKFSSKY